MSKQSLYNRFMSMSARPTGFLGQVMLHFMNLAHTPMARWNLSLIDFTNVHTILDEGCGGGKNIERMLRIVPEAQVYGIDYSEKSVIASQKTNARWLNQRCFITQGNAMALDFEDSHFDLVTAFETVYFWPDLHKAFAETYRVLKPNGLFAFSYGDKADKTMSDWEQTIDTMHLLPIDEVQTILASVGFSDISVQCKGPSLHIQCRK